MSFDIYVKFLIFWYQIWKPEVTLRRVRGRNVKKMPYQLAENGGKKQIPLKIAKSGKTEIFLILNCLQLLRYVPSSISNGKWDFMWVSRLMNHFFLRHFRAFSAFSTLYRHFFDLPLKSKSTGNNLLPLIRWYEIYFSTFKYF